MRFLIVSKVNHDLMGGIESQQTLVSAYLSGLNHSVTLISPKYREGLLASIIHISGTYALKHPSFYRKYDYILINDPHLSVATLACLFKRSRIVLFSHGWIFHTKKTALTGFLFRIWARFIQKFVHTIACTSDYDSRIFIDRSNIRLACNPVSLAEGPASYKQPGSLVIVARNAPNKNWPVMAKIVELGIRNNLFSEVYVVGGGVRRHFASSSELIHVLEDISDTQLHEIYAKSDSFLSLSKYEGFGLTVVEAMSFGCRPILSSIDAYQMHHGVVDQYIDINLEFNEIYNQVLEVHLRECCRGALMAYASKFSVESFISKIGITEPAEES